MPLSRGFRGVMQDFESLKIRFSTFSDEADHTIPLPDELYEISDLSRGIHEGEIQISKYVHCGAKEIQQA